jgi:hypothetical protein
LVGRFFLTVSTRSLLADKHGFILDPDDTHSTLSLAPKRFDNTVVGETFQALGDGRGGHFEDVSDFFAGRLVAVFLDVSDDDFDDRQLFFRGFVLSRHEGLPVEFVLHATKRPRDFKGNRGALVVFLGRLRRPSSCFGRFFAPGLQGDVDFSEKFATHFVSRGVVNPIQEPSARGRLAESLVTFKTKFGEPVLNLCYGFKLFGLPSTVTK